MIILLLILIGVVVFGLAAGYFYNRNIQKKIDKGELKEEPEVVTVDSECCGQHQICEKESLLAAVSKQIDSKAVAQRNIHRKRPTSSAKSCTP